MRFADIIGNEEAVGAVIKMVDSDKIPHGLLLSGPSGIGKMNLARAMAAYINCENRTDGDSCGQCPSCRRMALGNNPDLQYIYPVVKSSSPKRCVSEDYAKEWSEMLRESPYMSVAKWLELLKSENSQPSIYVDEAERISGRAAVSSYADRFKIFIIWLPERMRPEAANKLLKTLEEPFEDTLFICVSNDPESILPTIYSRLRRVEMRPPTEMQISEALMRKGVDQNTAFEAARLADGSLQRAFDHLANRGETDEFVGYFRDTMRAGYARKAGMLKNLSETFAGMGREKGIRLLDYFAGMTRENFIANLGVPPLNLMSREEEEFSSKFSPFIHAGNAERIISEIDLARRDLSRNANAKVIWFDLLLRLMILVRMKKSS